MNTSDLIRKLCDEHNFSIAELARKIGQSPQNFGKKLKRNTVSEFELNQIADVFGMTYEQAFISANNQTKSSNLDDEDLIKKYISDEFGLTIQSIELNSENIDNDYVKLGDDAFAKINSIFHSMPHYIVEHHAEQMMADAYKVVYDKGLGHLQQSAKNRELIRANVVEFGKNNNIVGQAELEKLHMKIASPVLAVFDIAAIITSQYYLARIDSKLSSLDDKLEHVQKFLEESKKSDLWANGQFLRDVSSKIYEIIDDEQYRKATLINVQSIRKETLSNVFFYHRMIENYVENDLNKNSNDYSITKDILNRFYEYFDAYLYSIYVYGFAYVIEVILSQNTNEAFLSKVKVEIQSVIDTFQDDHGREIQHFIDSVKSLNPGLLTKILADYGLYNLNVHINGDLVLGTLAEILIPGLSLLASYNKRKKKNRKDEIIKITQKNKDQNEKTSSELNSPLDAVDKINTMYNEPVEMIITKDAAYIKLNMSKEKGN